MFKSLLTILSGKNQEPAEAAYEGNITGVLDQQLVDRLGIVERARRLSALAIAQQRQEKERFDTACHGIADLEARAKWALEDGDEVLAHQAAEVIASLEAERDAARNAIRDFERNRRRLNAIVRSAEARVLELKRGQQCVRAAAGVQRPQVAQFVQASSSVNLTADVDAMLEKLRLRQKEIDDASAELDKLDQPAKPVLLTRQLSDDGYGKSIGVAADAVLDRLRTPRHTQACSF